MDERSTRAELAHLRARMAQLESRQRADVTRRRFPRRLRTLAVAGAFVALTPLTLLAANPTFGDLNSAAPEHRDNIQAIGNAGITTGFADPAHPNQRLYDPKATVTREEMASFLARTAGLGTNPPVANAASLQGYGASGLARVAGFGDNSSSTGIGLGIVPRGADLATAPVATLGTATVLAPTPGYVLVRTTVSANATPGTIVALRLQQDPDVRGLASAFFRATAPPGATSFVTMSPGRLFAVTAGYHTFALQGAAIGNADTDYATAMDVTMDALFVPFNGSGDPAPATTP